MTTTDTGRLVEVNKNEYIGEDIQSIHPIILLFGLIFNEAFC